MGDIKRARAVVKTHKHNPLMRLLRKINILVSPSASEVSPMLSVKNVVVS